MDGAPLCDPSLVPCANRAQPQLDSRQVEGLLSMSELIDHAGKSYGCLYVVSRAPSIKYDNGAVKACWNVRCECGNEKVISAQFLTKGLHKNCGQENCSLRWGAPMIVQCVDCGVSYEIKRRGKLKTHRCRACCAKIATASVIGKPANNRLENAKGGFNLVLASYRKSADARGIKFDLTESEFAEITKQDCHYCGSESSSKKKSKRGNADAYIYNGVDRIDSTKGYSPENVVPCCSICNYMKQELNVDVFLAHVEKIYNHAQTVPPGSGRRVFHP